MTKKVLTSRLCFLLLSAVPLLFLACTSDGTSVDLSELDTKTSEKFDRRSSNFNFSASLKGANEVQPVATNATGNVNVKISKDESSIYYKVTVGNIDNVRASHFHMAPPGVNGPVVVTLFTDPRPAGRTNGVLAEGTISASDVTGLLAGDLDALIDRIRNGRIYVNVHTVEFPSGELRGNL